MDILYFAAASIQKATAHRYLGGHNHHKYDTNELFLRVQWLSVGLWALSKQSPTMDDQVIRTSPLSKIPGSSSQKQLQSELSIHDHSTGTLWFSWTPSATFLGIQDLASGTTYKRCLACKGAWHVS